MPSARHRRRLGLPPGTLVQDSSAGAAPQRIDRLVYDSQACREETGLAVADLSHQESQAVNWVRVIGLGDVEAMHAIGRVLAIHPLVLEDIVHTDQRAKVERFEDTVFLVARLPLFHEAPERLEISQVSLVLRRGMVVQFEQEDSPVFASLRERILQGHGLIRGLGSDYLAYAVLDIIVDHAFVALDGLSAALETIEELALEGDHRAVGRLHRLRRMLVAVRRSVAPLREAVASLLREEHALVGAEIRPYLRDLLDHITRIAETVESLRELAAGLLDLHLAAAGNRMNQVMKVLTMIATIFIPLTFIAGIYGMNFEHMPELAWKWSYPVVLGLCVAISVGMLWWFRRQRWW